MDRKQLSQYKTLKKEIKDLETKIKLLEDAESKVEKDSVMGSNPEFPYQPISFQIQGIPYHSKEISKLKVMIEDRKSKSDLELLKIQEFIYSIDDSRVRMIFEKRYIENKSWISISMDFGADYSEYARVIHDRYLHLKK